MVQAVPQFGDGTILRGEMLRALTEYTFGLGALLYQDCGSGIVSGCRLTTTEDAILLNPGVVRFDGELYLICQPMMAAYEPTDTVRILRLRFHDKVSTKTAVSRELTLCFSDMPETDGIELCRFKLQPKAKLRYVYDDFADRETEYDTLNVIHAPFCCDGGTTLSPEMTRHFAREALDAGAEGADAAFALQLLTPREPVRFEALQAYLRTRLGRDTLCRTNEEMYHGLLRCLNVIRTGDTPARKRSGKRMMLVD